MSLLMSPSELESNIIGGAAKAIEVGSQNGSTFNPRTDAYASPGGVHFHFPQMLPCYSNERGTLFNPDNLLCVAKFSGSRISHYSTFFGATVQGEVLTICLYSSLGMDI